MTINITFNNSRKNKRKNKGKSIISNPTNYIVIDIETTGLDPEYCEIIELAAIKYENNQEIARFNSLVKPDYEIDNFITDLTGITNEMVKSSPKISKVIIDFYNFIKEDILIGHCVYFDINFIYDVLEKENIFLTNDYINIMRFSNRILPQLENQKLNTISSHYNVTLPNHRALTDCVATNECYQKLLQDINTKYSTFEEFKKSFSSKSTRAKDITATTTDFNEDHPLFNKTCVFTGTLEHFVRRDAMQFVVNLGGFCEDNVTKRTNYLVLGNLEFSSNIKNGKSNKLQKAETYILKGQELEIISENVFLDLLSEV
jgi:exonuclease, DNA polymerase III, epsilon subunit family